MSDQIAEMAREIARLRDENEQTRADNKQIRAQLSALNEMVGTILEASRRVERGVACVEQHYGPLDEGRVDDKLDPGFLKYLATLDLNDAE